LRSDQCFFTRTSLKNPFKQLWTLRFGQSPAARREFGPDISWHVIRSYIKGLSSEDLLVPEEYRQLDKKQVTVTQKTYERVYQNVWMNWFKPLSDTDGYWDDQDLARYLIEEDDSRRQAALGLSSDPSVSNDGYGLSPVHPVIFCDESQDFTRIELEVILRLSLFAERALGREEVPLVPFVFAGDQFQTLNPTGFRWEAIKAFFVEKFILALATHRPKSVDLNYRELTFNYRSSKSIVRFSNYVQALRARLFDLALRPQQPWEHEQNPPPVTQFLRDNDEFWTRLKKESDVVVIIPCGEGEEISFVRDDPVLKTKVGFNDDGSLDMTVISAVGAKGLEFPRVVVYGFGDAADPTILEPLKDDSTTFAADPDRSLPLQYFINRLYVAVSRAKRRMFIVDSTAGFKRLWDFAQNEQMEEAILKGFKKDRETWEGAIERLQPGRTDDLSLDRAADPLEIAVSLASDGRARSYAPHLLQAANIYKNNGQLLEATRCKADAARIESKFIEAAYMFLECHDTEQATDCFWRAEKKGWNALCDAAEGSPDLVGRLEYGFARAIGGKPSLKEVTDLLERLNTLLKDEKGKETVVTSSGWTVALRALLDSVAELTAVPEEWLKLSQLVEKAVAAGIRLTASPRALLAFRANELETAIRLWDSASERGSQEYRVAKALTSSYPEKIVALDEVGKRREVVHEFEAHKDVSINREQSRIVGRAYLSEKNFGAAFPLFVAGHDFSGLAQVVANTYHKDPQVALKSGVALFAIAADAGDWLEVLSYVDGKSLPGLPKADTVMAAWIVKNKEVFDLALVRAASRSDSLSRLSWDAKREKVTQRPFAEYIQKTFVVGPGTNAELIMELGAAIERCGRRIDSLSFYESVQKTKKFDEELQGHASERWVACKERHARFLQQDGDKKGAEAALAEVQEARQQLGMNSDDKVDEFPKLDSLDKYLARIVCGETEAPHSKRAPRKQATRPAENSIQPTSEPKSPQAPAPAETVPGAAPDNATQGAISIDPVPSAPTAPQRMRIGDLDVVFYRDTGRINISDQKGSTAFVRLERSTCTSEDVTVTQLDGQAGKFNITSWGLIIDLTTAKTIRLSCDSGAVELPINL
jgi:hypothetical protein